MFSEYFDIKKWDILRGLDEKITDEFSDEKQSDKNSEVLQPSKEDNKITKILETHINSRTGEYWSFFNNFPNAFHVDTSGRSIWKDIYEVWESEIWWITEKKIKWFDKTFGDGKSVEVREDNWDILFSFKEAFIVTEFVKNEISLHTVSIDFIILFAFGFQEPFSIFLKDTKELRNISSTEHINNMRYKCFAWFNTKTHK